MKAVFRKAAALGLVFAMSCTALAGCGSKGSKIDGSKTLMTVNGEDVRLGVGSLYAKYQQASIYQIYSMYFGTTSIFDNEHDDGHTYGEEIKESVISDLEKMVTIKQHAEEYGVSLTDEETAAIETAAQAYMDGNDEETRAKIGAAKEDVVELMTLQTLQASMMDPIVKDVDTEISDEDAQQTSVSYIRIDVESEPEETESVEETVESGASGSEAAESETAQSAAESSEAASAESAAGSEAAESEAAGSEAAESEAAQSAAESSEAASAESAAGSEAAESEAAQSEAAPVEATASSVEEAAAQIEAREYGEAIISAIQEEADVAEADLDAIAKTIDESYYVSTGSFTTNDPDDTYLDSVIVEAVKGLSDGELVDHPVMNADGTCYYVIRLDKNFDEEKTETKKSDILTERKQALYDETVNGWVDAADIKVNEDVWKLVGISDMDESTSESAVSEAESAAESAASEAESAAGSAASEAESAAESAASEAESAAESAASEAESTVESAVSEAASTAESAE